MKTIYNTISRIGFLAVVGFSGILTGCSNDFDFDEARRENPEFVYRENFEKYFGVIDPNQSWDFTNGAQLPKTRAITTTVIKPISGLDFGINAKVVNSPNTDDGKKEIENTKTKNTELYDELTKLLPDGQEHSGDAAVLTAPSTGFLVYPVLARGAYKHDLYINVGGSEYKVYSKNWTKWDQAYVNGSYVKYKQSGNKKIVNTDSKVIFPGVYVEAPVGTTIQIYLKNVQKQENGKDVSVYSSTDVAVGTGSGNAILVDCTKKPKGLNDTFTDEVIALINAQIAGQKAQDGTQITIPDDSEIKFVGIEDNYNEKDGTVGGDKDYNDVVLVIVGAWKVPIPIDIHDGGYEEKSDVTKRYLVEDLGAVDKSDIDFNDVVIDLNEHKSIMHKTVITNGVITSDVPEDPVYTYSATVRALGGTKNISVFLGNASNNVCIFTKDQYGDPDGNRPSNVTYNSSYSNPANLNIDSGTTASVMYNTFNGNKTYKGVTDKKYDTTDDGSKIATINLNNLPAGKPQWNPSTNNIFVKVYHNTEKTKTSGTVKEPTTIYFPNNGDIPYMIAVDTDKAWNKERVSVFDLTDSGNVLRLTNHIPSSN